ncbi:MAG TPA: ATP-binding protein [Acidisarcina sp.]
MAEAQASTTIIEKIPATGLFPQLQQVSLFADSKAEDLNCLGEVELVHAPVGSVLIAQGQTERWFWVLLDGQVHAKKAEKDGTTTLLRTLGSGETFGEVALLARHDTASISCHVDQPSTLVRVSEDSFWRLMANCPHVRDGVLQNMARRIEAYQVLAIHREKLISLGTLAAGLMHELNNPGAAARRASSQLRENLRRMQKGSLRFLDVRLNDEQISCMRFLQEHAMNQAVQTGMACLDQSDKEEELAEWLQGAGIEGGWQLAPTLAAIGLSPAELECAHSAFQGESFSEAINWVEALSSSMQLVGTIEESITRVSELVAAVKKYSYEDKSEQHLVEIQDALLSTLTILGHKLRQKEIRIEKNLEKGLAPLLTRGTGLNQVWTNLLDNAIDASPQKGTIRIRTWTEDSSILVSITNGGPAIPEEHRHQIFEPFFTTKEVGVGTGLGLDIAHRIVVGNYGGEISFTSEPDNTEFVVRLPYKG